MDGDFGTLRPAALITGVGRAVGIGAGIAARLADVCWDFAPSEDGPWTSGQVVHADGGYSSPS